MGNPEYNERLVDIGVNASYRRENIVQIVFPSIGCQHRPHCVMCNYGYEIENCDKPTAIEIVKRSFEKLVPKGFAHTGANVLLLNTYGSICDPMEMKPDVLRTVLDYISNYNEWTDTPGQIKELILETGYDTIFDTAWQFGYASGIRAAFEMGFETLDDNLRSQVLHKTLIRDKFLESVEIIHKMGDLAIANVLLGVPYLTPQEQIEECLKSIMWLIDNCVDHVVVFPVNVKPRTELFRLYNNGLYQRVSHQQIINLLNKIPDAYLPKVTLSWYGDRQYYRSDNIGKINICGLPPDGDPRYIKDYMGYYRVFNQTSNLIEKRTAINNLALIVLEDKRKEE